MHPFDRVPRPVWALRISGLCLSIFLMLTMTGCSDLAVALGFRQRLDKVDVTAVQGRLVDNKGVLVTALGPGQSAKLVLVATGADGKQYVTVGAGHGKVDFNNYKLDAQIVSISAKGVVSLPSDPRISEGKKPGLTAAPVAHPEVVSNLDIPVRYDLPFVANFSGQNGANGVDGLDGMDGHDGHDASIDVDPETGATHQGPGGNGGDGTNGGDGGNGQNGDPGEAVHVWVTLEPATRQLQIKVASTAHQSYYRVDPSGGSLKVLANGGAGGRAGQGGRAGSGGNGGDGDPPGTPGIDGFPGSDGRPGAPGAAGTILVSVDPTAQPYMRCLSWSNSDGAGRAGSQPKVVTEPVGALW